MFFSAYPDESEVINRIQTIRNEEYALLRLTFTMIDKNILDANGIMRDLLSAWGVVDYCKLGFGRESGITQRALFIQSGRANTVSLGLYRANKRGDCRFSIEGIKQKVHNRELNEGDLLYFSVIPQIDGTPLLFFINLTHNVPSNTDILRCIGADAITNLFSELKPKLREIVNGGYYDNSKGCGPLAPKDVGDTLEAILGIRTNNRMEADVNGLIEIKAKSESRTLDTLFTLKPRFDDTRIALYEPIDRNRVSAFARVYGYDSDKHPGYSSLYVTIGSLDAPQNNQGFYLQVNDEYRTINLVWCNPKNGKKEIAAYWFFDDLRKQLYTKHPATLWIKAESRMNGSMGQFKYSDIEFARAPKFSTFLELVKAGVITYDWRGYTTKEGPYSGKNHGNAWRIKPNAKASLFGTIEKVDLS